MYLESDAAYREIFVVLEHAEILGHEGSSVDQAHSRLGVTFPVVVLLGHVLQPGQTEVRRRLVTLCYPAGKEVAGEVAFSLFFYFLVFFLKVKLRFKSVLRAT